MDAFEKLNEELKSIGMSSDHRISALTAAVAYGNQRYNEGSDKAAQIYTGNYKITAVAEQGDGVTVVTPIQ